MSFSTYCIFRMYFYNFILKLIKLISLIITDIISTALAFSSSGFGPVKMYNCLLFWQISFAPQQCFG